MAILILAAACGERDAIRAGASPPPRLQSSPQPRDGFAPSAVRPPLPIGLDREWGHNGRNDERH